jgi:signal transduction histidine kinase/CheY-like chemotaxis protein/ligand-binding sensor domain-containing protein
MRKDEHPLRTGLGAIFLALILAAPGAFSQTRPEWRSWTAADGMPESYIRSIAAGPDGRVWARHGTVDFISVLDGYGIVKVPELRTGIIASYGTRARTYASPGGEAWMVEKDELLRLISGKWVIEVAAHAGDRMLAAMPGGGDRVWVLFTDRLAAYHPRQRTWSVVKLARDTCLGEFLQMVPGFQEDFWITGTRGIARFQSGGGEAAGRWTQSDTLRIGMRNAGFPLPAAGEELFVAGRIGGGSHWAVARWKGLELEIVYRAEQDNVRGWRGPDGQIWVLDGASLLRQTAGGWRPVPRRGALLGTVNDVLTDRDGGFWIGTSEGLTKYSAPVWRTPDPVADLEAPVHSIAEDRQGRLWFAATEYLLELDGSVWRRHRLPFGIRTQTTRTRSTLALPDGRIAVKVGEADVRECMAIFDPRTQRFEFLRHPNGLAIGLMVPRRDGTFWVSTKPGYGIEIWDGKTFRPQFTVPSSWKGDDIRSLLEDRNGTLWMGGAGAAGAWRNGILSPLRPEDGFSESGGFDFAELQSGRVLAGGRDKVLQFDGRRWSELKSGLDRVRTIAETRDGTLWVASGTGLHRYRNGEWIDIGEEDGLPSNAVYAVFEDSQSRIWAGSSMGLSLYHPEADRDAPRAGFAAAGNMKVAGPDGLQVFFSGIDKWKRTLAYRLLFSFRLDSGAWSAFAAERSATLHGLDPGRHRIHLRGMDRNGNMQQASDSFEFAVVLPWYRQGGFLAITFGAGLAIAILFGVAIANYRQRGLLIVELNQARLAAESASRQKSQFLANMSHEIRTPMNAVMGMTGLALEMAQSSQQRDYLSTVQLAANSLLGILNDILDFSKVEAGKLELETVDFDLEKCIQHVLRTLSIRAEEKGLTLALRMAVGVPGFLAGDPHRLQQILLNLVGNAIKFTAAGEVRLEARLQLSDAQSAGRGLTQFVTLEFVVTDTGIGVSPGKQQAIFAPFEQEDSSTTRKYGGTGLGLAICAKLVEMMQGRIWIESPWHDPEAGRRVAGSAFHFTARFLPGKAPVPEMTRSAGPAPCGLRILLAEDNPVNRKLAVLMLERRGHTVRVAENGREAIEILKREGADIVLMDIQMPEMDGFEATAAIRESEKGTGRHVPIVALTAHAMRGDSERCLAQGMDAYLAKPIRADDLDRVLSEVMCAVAS